MKKGRNGFQLNNRIFIILILLGSLIVLNQTGILSILQQTPSTLNVYEPQWATISCENIGQPKLDNFVVSPNVDKISATCSSLTNQGEGCKVRTIDLKPFSGFFACQTYVEVFEGTTSKGEFRLCEDGSLRGTCFPSQTTLYNQKYIPDDEEFTTTLSFEIKSGFGRCDTFSSVSGTFEDNIYQLVYTSNVGINYKIIPDTEGCYWRDVDAAIAKANQLDGAVGTPPTREQMQQLGQEDGISNVIPTKRTQLYPPRTTYNFVIGYQEANKIVYQVNGQYKYCDQGNNALYNIKNIGGLWIAGDFDKNIECCFSDYCQTLLGPDYLCETGGTNPSFTCKTDVVEPSCFTDIDCSGSNSNKCLSVGGKNIQYGASGCVNGECTIPSSKEVQDCPDDCLISEVYDPSKGECVGFTQLKECPVGYCCTGQDKDPDSPFILSQSCESGLICDQKVDYIGECKEVSKNIISNPFLDFFESIGDGIEDILSQFGLNLVGVGWILLVIAVVIILILLAVAFGYIKLILT